MKPSRISIGVEKPAGKARDNDSISLECEDDVGDSLSELLPSGAYNGMLGGAEKDTITPKVNKRKSQLSTPRRSKVAEVERRKRTTRSEAPKPESKPAARSSTEPGPSKTKSTRSKPTKRKSALSKSSKRKSSRSKSKSNRKATAPKAAPKSTSKSTPTAVASEKCRCCCCCECHQCQCEVKAKRMQKPADRVESYEEVGSESEIVTGEAEWEEEMLGLGAIMYASGQLLANALDAEDE